MCNPTGKYYIYIYVYIYICFNFYVFIFYILVFDNMLVLLAAKYMQTTVLNVLNMAYAWKFPG